MPSTLTAMRCDDLSICTTTPALAGVSATPAMTAAAAKASRASPRPANHSMISRPARFLVADMMSSAGACCKDRRAVGAQPSAVNLNPPPARFMKGRRKKIGRLRLARLIAGC